MAEDTLAEMIAEKQRTHGDFTDHGRVTQNLKRAMRASPNWEALTDTQKEGLEMIQHKIARVLAGNPDEADHWIDVEGYARITRARLAPAGGAA